MPDLILLTLSLLGGWISYWDIRKGEIKNYNILILILVGIFINVFLTKAFISQPLASAINIFFAVVSAVIIWIAGLWSVADAKLFIGLVFFLPITLYQYSPDYFPGFSIFVNSFIPLFLFLSFQAILKTDLKEKRQALNQLLRPEFVFHLFLAVFAIFCFTLIISQIIGFRVQYFIWLPLLFSLFWVIEERLKIKLYFFFTAIIFLALVFLPSKLFTPYTFFMVLATFLLIFGLFFIISLGRIVFTQTVEIKNLKEGMIPAEMVVKEGRDYAKKPITFLTFLTLLRERSKYKPIIGYNPDGLEMSDIILIQSLAQKKRLGFGEIKISKTLPFAPVLLFGVLVTYFLKGSFIHLLT